jgi:hypothetical protein
LLLGSWSERDPAAAATLGSQAAGVDAEELTACRALSKRADHDRSEEGFDEDRADHDASGLGSRRPEEQGEREDETDPGQSERGPDDRAPDPQLSASALRQDPEGGRRAPILCSGHLEII